MKIGILLVAVMVAGCAGQVDVEPTAGPTTGPASRPAARPGSASPAAEAVHRAAERAIDGIEADLPRIARIADEAARAYVESNIGIRAAGDPVFVMELVGRCGGIIAIEEPRAPAGPEWKGIVLYALRRHTLADDMLIIRAYRAQGCKVIVFSPKALLADKRHKLEYDAHIDTHTSGGGLFNVRNRSVIPLEEIASCAAGWTFTAEFVAACTRRARMPAMYEGYAFGGKPRDDRLGAMRKFHDEVPKPAAELLLGKKYLAELRKTVTVLAGQIDQVKRVADMAIAARDGHRGVYVMIEGHAMIFQPDSPLDAGVFTRLGYWQEARKDVTVGAGDLIFGVGYAGMYQGPEWNNFAEKMRATGAKLAWTFSGYKAGERPTTPADEPWIDQGWLWGDAVVPVDGYDIPILPASGVAQLLAYQMTCAEVLAKRPDHAVPKK